ncbi:methyltransferase-UbiE family protein [Paecilomyces variotii No. 5]|uniref:Methyltransferase-UbiE family protein n=1 Tax=Byssochlamys spectabilis (strain No. 5 / NBRC 109023) TaxID=1356009 RepID=V5FFL5_BYSSN|nr:methyltransferase-UbiE family protein [Paecilomyces variotii No. 5]
MPPQTYTNDHSTPVLRTHNWRNLSNSASYLLPYLQPNTRILDVGCGPGSITIDLARHVLPHGHVVGVEYVSDPLPAAQSFADAEGVSNVSFQLGDIHALPFADDSFDVVHAHQVLQHVADPVAALREMRRVVKKDGVVAARESASCTWYPDSEGLETWLRLSERMRRARGGNPHPGRMLHVWAKEAGFARERIKTGAGSWCFSSAEEREYWGGSMEERARSSGFVVDAVRDGFASTKDLDVIARGWRAFVEDEDAWFAMLHGEILCWK